MIKHRRLQKQAAFTLMEIIVAFAILIFGLIPLIALYGAATNASRESTYRIEASKLAATVLSDRKASGRWDDLPLEEKVHPFYPDYKYTLIVEKEISNDDAALVTMTIFLNSTTTAHKITSMKTLILRKP